MRMYFDNCALGRLTDDQNQTRIQNEAIAVQAALRLVRLGVHEWVSSDVLEDEILQNSEADRRHDGLDLISRASFTQKLTPAIAQQAAGYAAYGVKVMDALHLASAIAAGCSVLLTTDDRFVRNAAHIPGVPARFVRNPLDL